ncbi:MAG: phosphoribosylformylglycinamidine synthase [Oscillospiraceae bacterium]|nr:phosphoribosylformylglycinamidine synthase [Oscillospiraceae bacterium]
MTVKRIYIEKKEPFAVESAGILRELQEFSGLSNVTDVRLIHRYDVEGISETAFGRALTVVFSDPVVDVCFEQLPELSENQRIFATALLPGQYDQRADSCAECIQLMTGGERPLVRYARVYIITGDLSDQDFAAIKNFFINPIEMTEEPLSEYNTLQVEYAQPDFPEILSEFCELDEKGLESFITEYSLAMDLADLKFCQEYFISEDRPPTITELRVIDTYWSDHCRHTTFLTHLEDIQIEDEAVRKSYDAYLEIRGNLYKGEDRPVTLMDIATIGAKKLRKDGLLDALDVSEEINACSVRIKVDTDGQSEDWLLMFKNETHNHPTEIEPFGGASTCLGGAIRDPLAGRAYVFAAMRVTGAGDPLTPPEKTLQGKLPQYKITRSAAEGYSSYGNQIGIAAGQVNEIYHPGYTAKRMELGAVLGAVKSENVCRKTPESGDAVLLIGGKTGRDGCGGATGSSKSHTETSLESCSAEVQKGNPAIERRIQRLFRNPAAAKLIKRCNDFGAGGVSVAVGELADGLKIDLNAVPVKYDGLGATELAISESQERMAVVVGAEKMYQFIKLANDENLEATRIAFVTSKPYMTMEYHGKTVVDLSRDFLNSNGKKKTANVKVKYAADSDPSSYFLKSRIKNSEQGWKEHLSNINICSQKGLADRFDFSAGAGTVLAPLGGKTGLTPSPALAVKIPTDCKKTNTTAVMGWGYDPFLAEMSPYLAAKFAVIHSISKIISVGGSLKNCWLSFQEYYESLRNAPERWGKPFSALLGALDAQIALGCGSVGGKDSMSGSFDSLNVPPALISFAVSVADADKLVSNEFKNSGSKVILLSPTASPSSCDSSGQPDFDSIKAVFDTVEKLIKTKKAAAVYPVGFGGIAEAVAKMCFGNRIGFRFTREIKDENLFNSGYGLFLVELNENTDTDMEIGETIPEYQIEKTDGETVSLVGIEETFTAKLERIFPTKTDLPPASIVDVSYCGGVKIKRTVGMRAKPRVLIPVFPGTTGEHDISRVFAEAGGDPKIFVIKNRTPGDISQSSAQLSALIMGSEIVVFPGGSTINDGSTIVDSTGKFIVSFVKNPIISDQIHNLLHKRDGLILGIGTGFQALIRLGLLTYGKITDMTESTSALTVNYINRHQSAMVNIRVSSNLSPWLSLCEVGDVYSAPVSCAEGRFVASSEELKSLLINGQIAAQYVDTNGSPSMDVQFNPGQSSFAVESITSPDGRVLGKMTHSERINSNTIKNIPSPIVGEDGRLKLCYPGDRHPDSKIFEAGIQYFMNS